MIKIVEISQEHIYDHNSVINAFDVFGKLIVSYNKETWSYKEELFKTTYSKQYDNEEINHSSLINSDQKTLFYALEDEILVGYVLLRKTWNDLCYIDDLHVKASLRKKGVGSLLINRSELWANKKGLKGLVLETQDINLSACRFYIKNKFELGGMDVMSYRNSKTKNEKALFFYKLFSK